MTPTAEPVAYGAIVAALAAWVAVVFHVDATVLAASQTLVLAVLALVVRSKVTPAG